MASLPRCVVFDLDNCVWYPEMYHLWGGGGSPFTPLANGNVCDKSGTEVYLMGAVRPILNELHADQRWKDTVVCLASACDEPSWAFECLSKIVISKEEKLTTIADIVSVSEIHKGNKQGHLKAIQKQTGIEFQDMVFFDDHRDNCESVARLGVTCYYVPDQGVTAKSWATMLQTFPKPGEIFTC